MFSSDLKVSYHKDTQQLMQFEGRSNISDTRGNYQDVRIEYEYSSLAETPHLPLQKMTDSAAYQVKE